jgi:glyoxylase I family protein
VEPIGVHHVGINVTDTEEALRFYVDVLGLRRRTDRPDFGFAGAWLDAGNQQVHLLEMPPPESKGQHFALWFADLDAVVAELRDRGYDVSAPMGVATDRQAFVNDPSGNTVELHEVGA